jgi:hypothetical protein
MKFLPGAVCGLVFAVSGFSQPAGTPAKQTPSAPAAPLAASVTPSVAIDSLPPRPLLSAATTEKLARMKPIFDGVSLDGWIQAPVAPIRFASEDLKDLPGFAGRLGQRSDAVAAFLADNLDDAAKSALKNASATGNEARQATSAILRSVNRLVSGEASLFEEARFKGVTLRAETDALRQQRLQGWRLARLNRLLLEDAFPSGLVRSPAAAWVVKDGVMASTGAGRGVIYTAVDYTHYRLVFQVRQSAGNHVPGVLIFGQRPTRDDVGLDALAAIQFQVPNGGHWDYRVGMNKAGEYFTRPIRVRFHLQGWAQVEMLVNARNGTARMAVAQPPGTRAIENLVFNDPKAGRTGPIAWQMHNAGLFDEFRAVRIEIDPKEDRLITVE